MKLIHLHDYDDDGQRETSLEFLGWIFNLSVSRIPLIGNWISENDANETDILPTLLHNLSHAHRLNVDLKAREREKNETLVYVDSQKKTIVASNGISSDGNGK